jgi:hypothetical protein
MIRLTFGALPQGVIRIIPLTADDNYHVHPALT